MFADQSKTTACPTCDTAGRCTYACQQTTGERLIDGRTAARIEQALLDVFEKRFGGRTLPYEQARELVWLEREMRDHLVWTLGEPVGREPANG